MYCCRSQSPLSSIRNNRVWVSITWKIRVFFRFLENQNSNYHNTLQKCLFWRKNSNSHLIQSDDVGMLYKFHAAHLLHHVSGRLRVQTRFVDDLHRYLEKFSSWKSFFWVLSNVPPFHFINYQKKIRSAWQLRLIHIFSSVAKWVMNLTIWYFVKAKPISHLKFRKYEGIKAHRLPSEDMSGLLDDGEVAAADFLAEVVQTSDSERFKLFLGKS